MDYSCDICGERFDANFKLYRHKAQKHVPAVALVDQKKLPKAGVKRLPEDNNDRGSVKYRRITEDRGEKRKGGDIPEKPAKSRRILINEPGGVKRTLDASDGEPVSKFRKIDDQGEKRKHESDDDMPPSKYRKRDFHEGGVKRKNGGQIYPNKRRKLLPISRKRTRSESDTDYPPSKYLKPEEAEKVRNDRCGIWKREVAKWKRKYYKINKELKDLDRECEEKMHVLRGQIEELREDEYELKSISSNLINSVNIEDFVKIRDLITSGRISSVLRNNHHLKVLGKIFQGLSFGVIPVTAPQSLALNSEQKAMIRKLENATPSTIKAHLNANMNSFLNLFGVIDDSLTLVTNSYKRFNR